MQKYNHLIRTSAALVILSTLLSSPAKASRLFNISFFDGSGKQIGSGSFTDTENTDPVCFDSGPYACNHSGYFLTHLIQGFSANFPGINSVTPYSTDVLFYLDPSRNQSPGTLTSCYYCGGLGYLGIQQNQLRINPGGAYNANELFMNFGETTPYYASGGFTLYARYRGLSWYYSYHQPGEQPPQTEFSGSFIATSVPEPLNVLGASVGLGLILGLKRKIS